MVKIPNPFSFQRAIVNFASAVLLGLLFTSAAQAQQALKFHSDSYYPFNDKPEDAKPGYVIEILKAVFEKNGTKVEYNIAPWKRAVTEAENGTINGVIGGLKSDTPTFVFPEEPIGMNEYVVFVKKDANWTYSDATSLKGKRLGIINGYSYGDNLDSYIKENINTDAINTSSGENPVFVSIRKLQSNAVDAYVENKTVFWSQVAKMGLDKNLFVEAGKTGAPEPMYVAFAPQKEDSKSLAAALTTGIRALRTSGELSKILDKYNVKDWGKKD